MRKAFFGGLMGAMLATAIGLLAQFQQPGLPAATANGQLPIAASTGTYVAATLTAGSGISITNAANSITIANATVLDRDVTVNDVTNSSAETTVYSFSVPGGTLSTNRTLRLTILGDFLNNSGAGRLFTVKLKYGATTVLTNAVMNTNSSANRNGFVQEFWLVGLNATNAQMAGGRMNYTATALATSAGSMDVQSMVVGTNNGVAEDSTAAKTLSVTFQISGAEATSSIRCQTATLEAF